MKVCMYPHKAELGIGRVVDAYQRYLPDFGIQFVVDEGQADIVVVHAGSKTSERQPDIVHNHGLYPTATLDKAKHYFDMNADVIENLRAARVITVPSEWVAGIIRRDMLLNPVVLPHGIDLGVWPEPGGDRGNYVLWAKGHRPGVCNPADVSELAKRMPNTQFITTFSDDGVGGNVKVIGRQPFAKMKDYLAGAAVYLAITKETFGIQTLEAMACCTPVVGYDWGGTSDIVEHGRTGWLVKPGDIDGLVSGIAWAQGNRRAVGMAARGAVRDYGWASVCAELAELYYGVNGNADPAPDVSVVIPCYNYANWVGQAIESALGQEFGGDVEIIVVDDGSTDHSMSVIREYADRVTIIQQPNSGVAEARNCGIRHAKAELISCLDADDMYMPGFLATLVPAMDDRGIGIAYGGLVMEYSRGDRTRRRKGAWPPDFCFKRQAQGKNQVPSACVFRKEAWRRAGGYRAKYTPTEDAELWTRMTALGYDATRVTDDPVYMYRLHENSLSRRLSNPDYVEDKPWSVDHNLTPFAASACDHDEASFPVRNYDEPWVSVIIPVGPGHGHLVSRAVDSVWLQSLPYWEVIVVNDSGKPLMCQATGQRLVDAYPFIKLIELNVGNVSKARNIGVDSSNAELLVFLDADDWMYPGYLSSVVAAYNDDPERYVYTDWHAWDGSIYKPGGRTFSWEQLKLQALHPITALVPRKWHDDVGGFDEDLGEKGWEDWDYYLKMVLVEGHEGHRVEEPLLVYDSTSGVRRDNCIANKSVLIPIIKQRYGNMSCRRCGDKKRRPVARLPLGPHHNVVSEDKIMDKGLVEVRENSGNKGTHSVIGAATRHKYGRKRHGQKFNMRAEDQRAQPHLYVLTSPQRKQPRPMPARPTVSTPQRRSSTPPPPAFPAATEVVMDIPQEAPERVVDDNALEQYDADQEGIDIGLLTLHQIKSLDMDADSAADAYEAEAMGRGRKTVLAYLAGMAGDLLAGSDGE